VRVRTGEQFKCASPIGHSYVKTNSLHSVGGDVAETKGTPLGHDKSLVKGVTTTSKKSGTRQTRKMFMLEEQTGNQWAVLQIIILTIKPTRCTNFSLFFNIYMFRTVSMYIIRSVALCTQHNLYDIYLLLCVYSTRPPVPVAARSKAYVLGRSPAAIVVSNPTGGMDVFLL
jgi:hypothetical protein